MCYGMDFFVLLFLSSLGLIWLLKSAVYVSCKIWEIFNLYFFQYSFRSAFFLLSLKDSDDVNSRSLWPFIYLSLLFRSDNSIFLSFSSLILSSVSLLVLLSSFLVFFSVLKFLFDVFIELSAFLLRLFFFFICSLCFFICFKCVCSCSLQIFIMAALKSLFR